MVVGTARLIFLVPGATSLKDKRAVVRRLVDRTRARFNAAVAEVADHDLHQRAVLGVAVVSNDVRHATSMLDTIVASMTSASVACLVSRRTAVRRVGEHEFGDEDIKLSGNLPRGSSPEAWSEGNPDE